MTSGETADSGTARLLRSPTIYTPAATQYEHPLREREKETGRDREGLTAAAERRTNGEATLLDGD